MSRSPRVALVVHRFPQRSETFIVSKFTGLLARGWDVHMVCRAIDRGAWSAFPALDANGIARRIHMEPTTSPRWRAAVALPRHLLTTATTNPVAVATAVRHGARATMSLHLGAALARLKPDLIHYEFGPLARDHIELGGLLDCRQSVSFRGYDLNFVGLEDVSFYDEVWARIDAVHTLGDDLWARALARGCAPDMPHAIIPPAIDTQRFTPPAHRDSTDSLRILSVGRLEWKKGYEYALEAVAMLREQGVKVTYRIVGDGTYASAVGFARHQLGLDDAVTLVGAANHGLIVQELHKADVFLHAAVSEGFSNAVLEAQATGLPVVCSDADGLRENVADGVTGLVVPRRDPLAICDALARLAADPKRCEAMGSAGRERVVRDFQLSDQLDRIEQFVRLALDEEDPS